MTGSIQLNRNGALARVTLHNPGKFNSLTRVMWRELRGHFEAFQTDETLRCVVVQGDDGNFCSGGDIEEYPSFRFEEASLRDFHENDVWGGLNAMLQCDVPIIALIDGYCMGAGLEIASCSDLRLSSAAAKFGAPIGRLGFPMAPKEATLVADAVGLANARAMLLAGAVLDSSHMLACGFLNEVCLSSLLTSRGDALVQSVRGLAPQAARKNKQTLRAYRQRNNASNPAFDVVAARDFEALASDDTTYSYAPSAEHREGIEAFLAKRKPNFGS
jgi:enoyl-CoA hydratase/carnithine racemase